MSILRRPHPPSPTHLLVRPCHTQGPQECRQIQGHVGRRHAPGRLWGLLRACRRRGRRLWLLGLLRRCSGLWGGWWRRRLRRCSGWRRVQRRRSRSCRPEQRWRHGLRRYGERYDLWLRIEATWAYLVRCASQSNPFGESSGYGKPAKQEGEFTPVSHAKRRDCRRQKGGIAS